LGGANAEDKTNGRFWQGRFKCQLLLSEKSILAAMAYVDLNPIRAKVAESVTSCKHTSVRIRGKAVRGDLKAAAQPLKPLLGCQSYNLPTLTEGEYIDLVDYTGRQVYPVKRGRIKESEPKALDKLGLNPAHWAHRVQAFGFELAFWCHWRQLARTPEAAMPRAGLLSERRKRELSNRFGAKWFRVIGELEDMIEKALEIKQRTLFGIGLARHLAKG